MASGAFRAVASRAVYTVGHISVSHGHHVPKETLTWSIRLLVSFASTSFGRTNSNPPQRMNGQTWRHHRTVGHATPFFCCTSPAPRRRVPFTRGKTTRAVLGERRHARSCRAERSRPGAAPGKPRDPEREEITCVTRREFLALACSSVGRHAFQRRGTCPVAVSRASERPATHAGWCGRDDDRGGLALPSPQCQ
jgi:hypothetical protein